MKADNPRGAFAQDDVADAVAVDVVDLLEIVEVDHHDGDRFAACAAFGDQPVGGRPDAAAVEAAGQRIGLRQEPGLLLGLAALADHFGASSR